MKKVFKYGTGQAIPEDAEYLCTKVETIKYKKLTPDGNKMIYVTENRFVWHYFLVETEMPPSQIPDTADPNLFAGKE